MQDQDQPEPTLADLLAEIKAGREEMRTGLAAVRADMKAGFAAAARDTAQVRADVLAVKADVAFVEAYAADMQDAMRGHLRDRNAHGRRDAA